MNRSWTSSSRNQSGSSSNNSSSSSSKTDPHLLLNDPFPEAIKQCPELKCVRNVPMDYDIYLDSSEKHWYLMVHCNVEGGEFPYVTFEITSNKLFSGKMIPTMRIIEKNKFDHVPAKKDFTLSGSINTAIDVSIAAGSGGVRAIMFEMTGKKPRKLDTRKTTLMELCKKAEKVRLGMGEYSLLSNNCQHFCNNILQKLGLQTTPTTVGPTTTEVKDIDDVDILYPVVQQDSGEDGGMKGT